MVGNDVDHNLVLLFGARAWVANEIAARFVFLAEGYAFHSKKPVRSLRVEWIKLKVFQLESVTWLSLEIVRYESISKIIFPLKV